MRTGYHRKKREKLAIKRGASTSRGRQSIWMGKKRKEFGRERQQLARGLHRGKKIDRACHLGKEAPQASEGREMGRNRINERENPEVYEVGPFVFSLRFNGKA